MVTESTVATEPAGAGAGCGAGSEGFQASFKMSFNLCTASDLKLNFICDPECKCKALHVWLTGCLLETRAPLQAC